MRKITYFRGANLWILLTGLGVCVAALFVQAQHLRFVCDDAFISFRYARNLAQGHGLVFNPGERVEGYTSLLWILLLTPLEALQLDMTVAAVWLGWGAAAATLLLAFAVGFQRSSRPGLLCLMAPALLGSSRIFGGWASGGLETSLYGLLLLLAVALAAREGDTGKAPVASSLCFAALALTRPEGIMAWGICASLTFARKLRPTHALLGGLLFGLPTLAHLSFRMAYYGELLPNTFHAKFGGFQWSTGLGYIWGWMEAYGGYLVLPMALFAGFRPARPTRPLLPRMLLGVVLANLFYLAAIGGDFYEFRFIAPLLAPLALLVQEALLTLHAAGRLRWAVPPLAVGVLALTLRPTFTGYHPPPGSTAPDANIEHERDLVTHRWRPIATWLERFARPDESIALGAVGVIPYYSRLRTVDVHGLTDRAIARGPVVNPGLIGHLREASQEYLLTRRQVTYLIHLMPVPVRNPRRICVEMAHGQALCFDTNLPRDSFARRLLQRGARLTAPTAEDLRAADTDPESPNPHGVHR